jgi:hypothetical protein
MGIRAVTGWRTLEPGVDYCPAGGWDDSLYDSTTGHYSGPRCWKATCPFCGGKTMWWISEAIVVAAPRRALRIRPRYPVPDPRFSGPFRSDVVGMLEECRGRCEPRTGLEYAFVVGKDSRGSFGAEAVLRGSDLPEYVFQSAALEFGLGKVAQRSVPDAAATAQAMFGLSFDLCRHGRAAQREEYLGMHLSQNGGQFVTSSKGFWRDAAGQPLKNVREAWKAAKRRWRRQHGYV